MKILVDEIPKQPTDCLFTRKIVNENWVICPGCRLWPGECDDTSKCSILRPITDCRAVEPVPGYENVVHTIPIELK